MSRSNKIILLILLPIALITGVAVYVLLNYPAVQEPEGTYLAAGGTYCARFSRENDNLRLEVYGDESHLDDTDKVMIIDSQLYLPQGRNPHSNDVPEYMILKPSKSIPGDWDLTCIDYKFEDDWEAVNKGKDESKLFQKREPEYLKEPFPSYLHRIEDERVWGYFSIVHKNWRSRLSGLQKNILLEFSKSLVDKFPDDLHIRTLYLDALIRNLDADTLESELAKHKDKLLENRNGGFEYIYYFCERAIEGIRAEKEGKNSYDFFEDTFCSDKDLNAILDGLSDVRDYEYFDPYMAALTGNYGMLPYNYPLKLIEVFLMESYFRMLEGNRREALDLLVSSYRLGQLFADGRYLIDCWIGFAMKSTILKGLEIFTLNAGENESQLLAINKELEYLGGFTKYPEFGEIYRREYIFGLLRETEYYSSNEEQFMVRSRRPVAELQNLRCGIAARYTLLTKNKFPETESEFAPLLPDGLLDDPFGDGPIKFINDTDSITLYSHGPDRDDDHAFVEYNPTNGTRSNGDIFLYVPKERKYPFPKDGLKANSRREVRRQFPNGLPEDSFADIHGTGLGVSEDEKSIYIYSVGPDVDQQYIIDIPNYIPTTHYDPTNGSHSDGDLFIKFPKGIRGFYK